MRDLAILTFVTLDGVMQAPSEAWEDRSGGFQSAGWARPYWDGVMAQVGPAALSEPYGMLFGRRTYENFHRASQVSTDESPMDAAWKHVVTSDPDTLSWANSTAVTGDIPKEIAGLKAQEGPLLQVHGSWQLIQLLLEHDLIDEFRLWTFPVSLGAGKRLFTQARPALNLIRAEPTGNGVLMSIYRRS